MTSKCQNTVTSIWLSVKEICHLLYKLASRQFLMARTKVIGNVTVGKH